MLLDIALNCFHRKKKLKDHEEYMLKTGIIEESKKYKRELSEVQNKINEKTDRIDKYFKKSETKEKELKTYIGHLNHKLYTTHLEGNDIYEKIDKLHKEIMEIVENLQEKVKIQISHTKEEMEREVERRFSEAERKQRELINEKMEEQRKVFDRMNYTKGELEKIRKRFEDTNKECEKLINKNTWLKVQLEITKKHNDILEKNLVSIQKEHNKVEKDYNELVYQTEQNSSDFDLNSFVKDNPKSKIKTRIYSATPNQTPSNRIEILKSNIEKIKNEYTKINNNFIQCQKEKTEAQQLLQKCIEDIAIQLNKINNKLSNDSLSTAELYRNRHIKESLEQKLKVLTYIYDNGMQCKQRANRTILNVH